MKRLNSLVAKILLLCTGLILASTLTIHYFAYMAAKSSIEDTIGQMAMNITGSVVTTIDTEQYAELLVSQDMNGEYYSQLKEELIKMRQSTGLEFLYTMSKTEDGTFIYVVDGTEAGSEDESLFGDVEEDISEQMLRCFEGEPSYEYYPSEEWGELISGYIPIKNASGEVIGLLGADFNANYMVDQLASANQRILLAGMFTILIGILLSFLVAFLIVSSLKKLQRKVEVIKNGDLTVSFDNKRKDEIGSLSQAFALMVDNTSQLIRNIRDNSEAVIKEVDSLNNSVEVTNKTTEEITKIVTEIASGASSQVDQMAEVEHSMDRVFTEIGKITDHIEQVNLDSDTCMKDMQEASDKLKDTVEQIELVNDTVDSTAQVMKNLEDKFKEVLAFSDIVSAISKQTNLLALNASIEAASAGEHGKGFAVVATEIKNLAVQSSNASKRINELILAVQNEIDLSSVAIGSGVIQARNGVAEMSEIKEHLNKLSESNYKINTRIKDISLAIMKIEKDGQNVLDKTTYLSRLAKEFNAGTQQTSAETEEQYAIMEAIRNDLMNVKLMMEELGQKVNRFKIN